MSNTKAQILSILRFSVHDGPGIRTTVFLKGCPLHCQWCHNPESINITPELGWFEEKCVHCGECVKVCPTNAHVMHNGKHSYNRNLCTTCGLCAEACVYDALKMAGYEMNAEEVLDEVLKDKHYYTTSYGGVTVSGGEPLFQPKFLSDFLAIARQNGLHTCIETSGYASRTVIDRVWPLVDYFLFDIKAGSLSKYKSLTGVENEVILSNLDYLYHKALDIELRCPMIPGINDELSDFQFIVALEKKYPNLKAITIMPYHNTGNSKYTRYGYINHLPHIENVSNETKEKWLNTLVNLGSTKVQLAQ